MTTYKVKAETHYLPDAMQRGMGMDGKVGRTWQEGEGKTYDEALANLGPKKGDCLGLVPVIRIQTVDIIRGVMTQRVILHD